ncbi:MAG: hypothetical protein V1798_01395 [Pseudomonadota bacterium]
MKKVSSKKSTEATPSSPTGVGLKRVEKRLDEFQKESRGFQEKMTNFQKETRNFQEETKIRLSSLEQKISDVKSYAGVLHEETQGTLKLIVEMLEPHSEKLENHETRIVKIEEEIPLLRAAVSTRRDP